MPARISLAGRISVAVNGHRVDERALPGAQARLVLSLLVRERHGPVTREQLATNLWPDGRPASWKPALRGVVSRARGFLVMAGFGDPEVVQADQGVYRVRLPDDLTVDLEQAAGDAIAAEDLLAEDDPGAAAQLAAAARAILARPLLPTVEAPWVEDQRRELEGLRLRATEVLAEARLELGEPEHAATAAEEVIGLDAFRESAHRLLIRAHIATGNYADGLWAYERCRGLIAEELGVDPAPETQALYVTLLERADTAETTGPSRAAATTRSHRVDECPYRGLRPFEEDDAPYFFGRSADVTRLLERLEDARFLCVMGPSGSGKSSLVRAGLVPALRRGTLPGSDTWALTVLRPGRTPLRALAAALGSLDPDIGVDRLAARLEEDEDALHAAVEATVSARRIPRVALCIDQLEEAFTLCQDEERRRAFLAALAAALRPSDGRLTIICTLRADFYPRLADHPSFADLASANQFLVTPMDEVGLADAIEGPARAVGLQLEAGLTETILRDVARQPGSLPLLGHCLVELWERRCGDVLTLAAYEETGGVEAALAHRAEAVYRALSEEGREAARRILLRLVHPGQGTEHTRRRVPLDALPHGDDDRRTVEIVVGRFVDARLLTTGGPPDDDRLIEVAHEALIRGWPRLRGWVEEDRAGLLLHRRLSAAAGEWERLAHDEGVLYRGAQLAEVAAWDERNRASVNPRERAFIDASVGRARDESRGQLRRMRRVVVGLVASVVVVAVLAAIAVLERNRAGEQRLLASSRGLAAEAINQLDLDPGLGLALAVEAVELAPTREAVGALRQALVTPVPHLQVPGGRRDFAIDPRGRFLVVGGDDGAAHVWDPRTGEEIRQLAGHTGPVLVSSFDPTGRLLVTTDSGAARVWDAVEGSLLHVLEHGAGIPGVAWGHEGAELFTADFQGTVRRWDVSEGRMLDTIATPGPASLVRVAPDGTLLAWSAVDPHLYVLDVAGDAEPAVLDGHDPTAVEARIGADGRHVVSVGFDGTARIWDLASGEQVAVLDGFASRVWTADLAPDGTVVIVGDATGNVRIAEVAGGDVRTDGGAHSDTVVDVAFSPDGAVAASISIDGTAILWDVQTGGQLEVLRLDGAASLGAEARSVLFTPDGREVLTRAASVQSWEVPTETSRVLVGHERLIGSLALTNDGARLASGGADGTVRIWDLDAGEETRALGVPDSTITAVSFSPDGAFVATANPFQSTLAEQEMPPTIWDLESGDQALTLPVPAPVAQPCPRVCQTSGIAFSPDGGTVLTTGQEGVARLWDAGSGELVRELEATDRSLRRSVFSPDGAHIAAAGWQAVVVWDTGSGEVTHELAAPGVSVAFDPAGEVVAVAGDDGIVSLWELSTGRLVAELRHPSATLDVAWSRDGRFLAAAAGDGAHLWDVASQRRIQAFTEGGGVHAVTFTGDDEVVTGGADGTVRFHRCAVCGSTDELLAMARERHIRPLSLAERDRFLQDGGG